MNKGAKQMIRIANTYEKIAEAVVDGYKKIENSTVNGYKKVENGAVNGFNLMCDKFIEILFAKEGESVEEAKNRLKLK